MDTYISFNIRVNTNMNNSFMVILSYIYVWYKRSMASKYGMVFKLGATAMLFFGIYNFVLHNIY